MTARETRAAPTAPSAAPGIIDTLSEGFAQIHRVIWVVLLPIALNAALSLLPQVSVKPLVDQWLRLYERALEIAGGASSAPGLAAPIDADMLDAVAEVASDFNVLSLAGTSSFYMGANPFLPWNVAKGWLPIVVPRFGQTSGGVAEINGVLTTLSVLICLPVLGLFVGTLYLSVIGAQVRDGELVAKRILWMAVRSWGGILGFVGLFLGAIIALSIPLSLLVGVLSMVAPGVAMLLYAGVVFGGLVVEFWMLMYLFFLVDAVVIGGYGPLRAAKSSLLVVRQGFWSALGLIGLTMFISLGLQVIWDSLGQHAWGLPLVIVGDAYVASGLVAASMVFYRSRAVLA